MISAAADGETAAREEFADCYERVLRSFFEGRWSDPSRRARVDDAVQEAFLVCFRDDGALSTAEQGRGPGFRAYLRGVARNVARTFERRVQASRVRRGDAPADVEGLTGDDPEAATLFDREYARSLLRTAGKRMRTDTNRQTEAHRRRAELLTLRFEQGLTIKDIAERWQVDNKWLHHQYEQAQKEFRACFRDVVAESEQLEGAALDRECDELLGSLR